MAILTKSIIAGNTALIEPFIEAPRFPDSVAGLSVGGPGFNTNITSLRSGHEQRNQVWSTGRGKWDFPQGAEEVRTAASLIAFHRVVKGRAHGFRFRDPFDHAVTAAQSGLLASDDGTSFALYKVYSYGGMVDYRRITKPDPTDFVLTLGGADIVSTAYALDSTTGIVTPTGPLVGELAWRGSFDVPARFEDDDMRLGHNGGLVDWSGVRIIELLA